ncbi:hypothetical protein [Streptomyces sp. NPDC020597]|uniref:hypothetical protein n=1 Tax=unclassified Streptomyces TaxID=2593676 RepID=UPI0037AF3817
MLPLIDVLRTAGILTALPVEHVDVLTALGCRDGADPAGPFDVEVTADAFSGTLGGVTVAGDASRATLTVPLAGVLLASAVAGQAVTVKSGPSPSSPSARAAEPTLEVSAQGVRWSGPGEVALTMSPGSFELPGPVRVTLRIDSVTLSFPGSEPEVEVGGVLVVGGVPGCGSLSLPFAVRGGRSGFNGGAGTAGHAAHAGAAAGPVTYSLGWSQAGDPFPTSIDLATAFPLPPTAGVISVPVDAGATRVRVRLARGPSGYDGTVVLEGGDTGILSSGDTRAAALGVLATATAGDTSEAAGRPGLAELGALIATAQALGTGFGTSGRAKVTGVRFAAPGTARVDYEAELCCAVHAMFLDAHTVAPLRVAVRDALLDYGTFPPALGLTGASIDVADAGRWEVTQPAGLLQVAGVRSGHGSSYVELDLRVPMNLGPLKVAGAVLRLSLAPGALAVTVEGFSLGVDVPGLVSGSGQLAFQGDGGFTAALRVDVEPLNLAASAGLVVEEASDAGRPYRSILADLSCDLPAPVPLADTGLGLFGIEAFLGLNRSAALPPGQDRDSIRQRLAWQPDRDHTTATPDAALFGAGVAVGTVPDLGFAFSALGRLAVRTPDISVVAATDAQLLAECRKVTQRPASSGAVSLLGLLVVDPEEQVYAGVSEEFRFPPDTPWALMVADVPMEARYPVRDPRTWFVHVGGDGRHGCGPIRAVVLPELFHVGADAYMMLHGDGFDPPLDLPMSPASGFGAAAGFCLSTRYGVAPAWADLSLGAVVALGTRPLFVAGRAHASGGLHLGPFSLGLDATLELQLGPGTLTYAQLRACGSVDLWFCEISGCVHIGFGQSAATQQDMPDSPLVSAAVGDRNGVALPGRADLGDQPERAPAMWPDGTVLLGFAPGPRYAGPPTDTFHDDLDQTSAVKGAGTLAAPDGALGSAAYPAHWSLSGLSLARLTDTGAAQRVPGPLPACWQLPTGTAPLAPTAGRSLALFTRNPALWSLNLLDGAAGNPADPVALHERACRGDWPVAAGWAVGGRAAPEGDGWSLPPLEDRPLPATCSTVRASAVTQVPVGPPAGQVPAIRDWAAMLLPGTALVPGGTFPSGPLALDGLPEFTDRLDLADFVAPRILDLQRPAVDPRESAREYGRQAETTLTSQVPLEPMVRAGLPPTLLLWAKSDVRDVGVHSTWQGQERDWVLASVTKLRSGQVGTYVWDADAPVDTVRVLHGPRWPSHDARPVLAVIAFGGVTTTAAQAAENARSASVAASGARAWAGARAAGPAVFAEGATYRLDVSWTGALDGDPRPPSGATESRYFTIARHAPKELPADVVAPHELYRSVSAFHPRMLGRYLLGYSVDRYRPWFWGDPVEASLASRTITQVADVYGYQVALVIDRTDPPPGPPQPGFLREVLLDAAWLRPCRRDDLLSAVDRRGVARAAASCPWPLDPVDAAIDAGLEGDASYEVGVFVEPRRPVLPERVATMLPRASFRTSHWPGPAAMLEDFGFGRPAPALVHVPARRGLSAPAEDSDGALRAALREADVDLGPLGGRVRTTVLWAPDRAGGHTVTALLLECDEPLVRGERLGDYGLDGFTTHTDSATTTLLFVADRPVAGGPVTLVRHEYRDPFTGAWQSAPATTLQLPLPSEVPALAWEVWP